MFGRLTICNVHNSAKIRKLKTHATTGADKRMNETEWAKE